jgi:hypothetical protein
MFGPLVLSPLLPERTSLQQAQGAAQPVHAWPGDAAAEMAQNFDLLLDFAASVTGVLKKLSAATYNVPEQLTLAMDIPQTIVINTDGGPLFIEKSQAELGHVRMWVHDGLQHHSSQKYRFNRLAKELKQLDSLPDELSWNDVRAELESGSDGNAE